MPAVVACGSRTAAHDQFQTRIRKHPGNEMPLLLVDSEGPVEPATTPWNHLKQTANLPQPAGATDEQCHLMVQLMESWFLADREALRRYFGPQWRDSALHGEPTNVESIPKENVTQSLRDAARPTSKGTYDKSRDAFRILETIDPHKVRQSSRHAERLLNCLEQHLGS